ncbi:Ig-like domain-containing protein [Lentibacter sp. XHP0401]|uniref:Ig-like domain-containing protein n=1 Tax=Lentibacter sp. XHP0401 TaxID=2984334 RepID=UPI0021E74F10|nr:Ig-like domain-containing protein [Lentibacter sp. XHP0401]MCV2892629.1 Ig-like domain-containing protein [Lentibacter sp. XHP0401]
MVTFIKLIRLRLFLGFVMSMFWVFAGVSVGHAQSVTVSDFRLQSDGNCGAGGASTTFLANALGPTGSTDETDAGGDPIDWIAFYLTDSAGVILGSATFNAPANSFLANDFFGTVQNQPTALGNFTFYVYDVDTSAPDQSIGATYSANGRELGSGSFDAAALDNDCTNIVITDTPPAFSTAFAPGTIDEGNVSTLRFTIDNTTSSNAATGLNFINNLPVGVIVATPANASTTCTGGTLSASQGSGTISYSGGTVSGGASCTVSADVTSVAGGTYLNVTSNLTSGLGNSGTASATLNVTAVPPTITIAPLSGPVAGVYTAVITLSEASTDFDDSDLTLTNATATLTGSGTSYTATLTPTADGLVALSVAAGRFTDAAGNGNTASNEVTMSYDGTPPVIRPIGNLSLEAGPGGTRLVGFNTIVDDNVDTGISPIFSLGGTVITSPYAFPVGANLIKINATDSAGNPALESEFTLTITPGTGPAAPTLTAATINPNRSMTIVGTTEVDARVTITFPDASVQTVTATGGSFSVTSTADMVGGTVSVTAEDSLGNESTAATVDLFPDYDAPTVSIAAFAGPTAGTYTAEITLSEASTDFDDGDLTLTNATATLTGSGASYTATLTPTADGPVTLSIAAGTFTDAAGNENTASNEVATSYDGTPPTIVIGALSGPTAGTYTAEITLSEASTDFDDSDLTLTNATATLTGSGTGYTAILTPAADGPVALSVAANRFTDAAGNGNTASDEVTAVFDGTPPTVSITNAPATVNAQSTFTVTITFSENVTGFDSSDILASNATVSSLTGSGAVYQASLTVSGSGAVTLVVPADAAVDGSNNGNLASNSVSIADVTVEQTQELIASFTQTRANQLIRSQPGLSGFMSGQARGGFGVNVTRGQSQFNFASNPDYPVWMQAQGSWSSNTTSKSGYMFGALGSHRKVGENLLIGAMVQLDHLTEDTGVASVSGTGWMVGPYFVAKSAEQPVYFEGRLLYGETNNTISPFGTYEDNFETTRVLVQFKVTGEYTYGTATTLYPFLDASYVTDDQHSYVDSLGNTIPGQGINLGQIEVGLDFKHEIPVSSGELELLGGMSGIWSQTGGSGYASTISPDYEGGRMRVELGINRVLSSTRKFNAATFYDGIGANGFESFGLSLGYEMQF